MSATLACVAVAHRLEWRVAEMSSKHAHTNAFVLETVGTQCERDRRMVRTHRRLSAMNDFEAVERAVLIGEHLSRTMCARMLMTHLKLGVAM
jgi:hypothetical protein